MLTATGTTMAQDSHHVQLTDETKHTVDALARYIKGGGCRNVVFLTGAGVSVAAGIPDFRSPGGMYDTLRPELLTASAEDRVLMAENPTYVVNRALFTHNQFPYMELRRPFIVGLSAGTWKPTLSHLLMQLFHEAGLLRRVYTQNIDGLDFSTQIPLEKIVSVHGTMRHVKCELCGDDGPDGGSIEWLADQTRRHIKDIYGVDPGAPTESSNIMCPTCNRPGLKPATVMYGGAMPPQFNSAVAEDFRGTTDVDLVVVMGTSLTVYPAAMIPDMASDKCHRILINNEKVGAFARKSRFAEEGGELPPASCLLGSCDAVAVALVEALGWRERMARIVHLAGPACQKHFAAATCTADDSL
jgi:NAD-dependent deacetylase sirtuin 2